MNEEWSMPDARPLLCCCAVGHAHIELGGVDFVQ